MACIWNIATCLPSRLAGGWGCSRAGLCVSFCPLIQRLSFCSVVSLSYRITHLFLLYGTTTISCEIFLFIDIFPPLIIPISRVISWFRKQASSGRAFSLASLAWNWTHLHEPLSRTFLLLSSSETIGVTGTYIVCNQMAKFFCICFFF